MLRGRNGFSCSGSADSWKDGLSSNSFTSGSLSFLLDGDSFASFDGDFPDSFAAEGTALAFLK